MNVCVISFSGKWTEVFVETSRVQTEQQERLSGLRDDTAFEATNFRLHEVISDDLSAVRDVSRQCESHLKIFQILIPTHSSKRIQIIARGDAVGCPLSKAVFPRVLLTRFDLAHENVCAKSNKEYQR